MLNERILAVAARTVCRRSSVDFAIALDIPRSGEQNRLLGCWANYKELLNS